jgi:elongation factor P--(R)-beta-lysine ligase
LDKSVLNQKIIQRARMNHCIREYMAARHVLEVETPILSTFGNTDPAIESFLTNAMLATIAAIAQPERWLRTSPEYFHKRLLAQGSGDIFELARVFRAGEVSTRHQPEFSMLEYYRLGFDEYALMAELGELSQSLQTQFGQSIWPIQRLSFNAWFQAGLDIDPQSISPKKLLALARDHGAQSVLDVDACLDFLRAHVLEPKLPHSVWTFIHDFPASQAALAKLTDDGQHARRFELFGGGFELANGYFELSDPIEQRLRFERDAQKRRSQQQPEVPMDTDLLHALETGLPSCAGVAVGLDRLLMLLTGAKRIDEVLLFAVASG